VTRRVADGVDDHELPGGDPEGRPPDDAGGTADPTETHVRSVVLGLAITVAFVVLDQLTKEFAERTLAPGEFVPWLGDRIGWQLVYNPGGAFGIPAPPLLFLVVSGLVLVVVLRALPRTASALQATAYGLLLSGALGNVIDRLLRPGAQEGGIGTGYVVDFVAWGSFPRFNVADSAITVGFVLLVVALFLEERREQGGGGGTGDLPGADRA
jgi:signal peptidase II